MKKLFFILVAVLSLSSCVNELWHGSSRTIGIKVVDIHSTKSSVAKTPNQQLLFSTPLDIEGLEDCYLEAWISDTGSPVATKGVQVDENNITHDEFGNFRTCAYLGEEVFENDDMPLSDIFVKFDGNTWIFKDSTGEHNKDYFWPDDGKLTFCSYSPASAKENVPSFEYKDSRVLFTYNSPVPSGDNDDAQKQVDFMVGCDADQSRYDNQGNATIHFCHALTSVKFVNGEIRNLTVESVTLENFYGSGNAVFNTTNDEKKLGHFEWTPTGELTSYTQTFSTAFDSDGKNAAGKSNFDTSSDQSCTFMVIPQTFAGRGANEEAKIIIKTNRDIHPDIELNLTKILTNYQDKIWTNGLSDDSKLAEAKQLVDWSGYAGKTITFRVGPKEITAVSIEVIGDICAEDPNDGIKVKNNGLDPVYVRADIVVNTRNKDSKIVNSFLNTGTVHDFVNDGVDFNSVSSDWVLKEDGYWYTTQKLASGESVNFISGFDWKRDGEGPVVELYNSKQDSKGVYHYYYNDYLDAYVIVQAVYGFGDASKPISWK